MRRARPSRKPEPTIGLINIVFLMLIFFLVAGTVSPPMDPDLELARASELEGRAPPDALIIDAEGTLTYRGEELEPSTYMSEMDDTVARIVPDRDAPAASLLEITLELRAAGAEQVMVVTERALE
ncbi:MAG: biopolymer transporter ExbD [Pseudomonadota bacterium]